MVSVKSLSRKGWIFIGLTLLLSCFPYYFIINTSDLESDWPLLLMWMPGVAAIILRLFYREGLFKGLVWNPLRNLKWIFVAAFIPLLIEILAIVGLLLFNGADFNYEFLVWEDGIVSIKGTALLFGAGPQQWYFFLPNYFLSYFVGTLIYSVFFALGEEYGWRGYLQTHWQKSGASAIIIIGIIWGLWHLPGILLGHNFPQYPLLGGLLLMPLTTVAFSFCFGAGFKITNSIWVAAIFHGALNISSDISNKALQESSINQPLEDAIWIGLWVLTGTFFYLKYFNRPGDKKEKL